MKLGGAPEFATRHEGLIGLKKVYGDHPTFVPLAIGLTYKALDTGQVRRVGRVHDRPAADEREVHDRSPTPRSIFGFQNVAPVVKQSVLAAEGPAFAQTINKVSALLTLPAIQKMNAAVALDQQPPAAVAHQFLRANGLALADRQRAGTGAAACVHREPAARVVVTGKHPTRGTSSASSAASRR